MTLVLLWSRDVLGVGPWTLTTCLVASLLKGTDEPWDQLALTVEQASPNLGLQKAAIS